MQDNIFKNYFGSDNDLCLPLVKHEQITLILAEVARRVGLNKSPKVVLDLEQLQVLDYRKLPLITKEQAEYINRVQSQDVIAPEELSYLALLSLFSFVWEEPNSEDDVVLAAAFELALKQVLVKHSLQIGQELDKKDALLPYWLRLSFLRVMSAVPERTIHEYGLEGINCIPIKLNTFNAKSIVLNGGSLIGFNYALEPILKVMNRYLMHFFTTQHLAGESRLKRAWNEIAPVVLHFSGGGVPASRISGYSILFSIDVAKEVHWLTATQIDFILMHEIGHVIYDHAHRIREASYNANSLLRHEFEYQADTFAQELLRSQLINTMRYELNPNRISGGATANDCLEKSKNALFSYSSSIEAVRLLFVYMDFIEKAKARLDARLSGATSGATQGSHPPAIARDNNLRKICFADVGFQSERVAYAKTFFLDLLSYVDGLGEDELKKSIERNNPASRATL
jgi:hypothetical protein